MMLRAFASTRSLRLVWTSVMKNQIWYSYDYLGYICIAFALAFALGYKVKEALKVLVQYWLDNLCS